MKKSESISTYFLNYSIIFLNLFQNLKKKKKKYRGKICECQKGWIVHRSSLLNVKCSWGHFLASVERGWYIDWISIISDYLLTTSSSKQWIKKCFLKPRDYPAPKTFKRGNYGRLKKVYNFDEFERFSLLKCCTYTYTYIIDSCVRMI